MNGGKHLIQSLSLPFRIYPPAPIPVSTSSLPFSKLDKTQAVPSCVMTLGLLTAAWSTHF